MKVEIVGIQGVDYVSRKTNKQVTGTTLHVTYPRDNVEGVVCESIFVSSRSSIDLSGIHVGDIVDLSYNRYGSVESLCPVN